MASTASEGAGIEGAGAGMVASVVACSIAASATTSGVDCSGFSAPVACAEGAGDCLLDLAFIGVCGLRPLITGLATCQHPGQGARKGIA